MFNIPRTLFLSLTTALFYCSASATILSSCTSTSDADPSARNITPLVPPKKSTVQKHADSQTPEPVPLPPKAKAIIPDGMLPVPGGSFTMGLNHPRAIPDEHVEHIVKINRFFLDIHEVTNVEYQKCVEAGICRPPKPFDAEKSGFARTALFKTSTRPVTSVSKEDANTYCKWRRKRLPTEAEFERAARGDDGRMYAWGNESPSPELAVYGEKVTAPVGSKTAGKGPYGHLDLAGNVWEWTQDLYDPFAYTRPTANRGIPASCEEIQRTQDLLRAQKKQGFTGTNPIPKACDTVLRGGAFNYFPWGIRASNRVHHPADWRMIMAGFRCAQSP